MMNKNIKVKYFLLILIFLSMPAFAQKTLNAQIQKQWTVQTARQEVFATAQQWVDLSMYAPFDQDIIANKEAINKKQFQLNDRQIDVFSSGGYGVKYYQDPLKSYYFNNDGSLNSIEFILGDSYPYKSYKHFYPDGSLLSLIINVAPGESYVFLPDGRLLSHWVGNNCYDVNGNITKTRKTIEE